MPFVYKYVLNDEILYIGKSNQKKFERIEQHGKGKKYDNIKTEAHDEIDKADIYFIDFVNPVMTDIVETILINKYKPKYNVVIPYGYDGLTYKEPKWTVYRLDQKKTVEYTYTELLFLYENEVRLRQAYQSMLEDFRARNESLTDQINILTNNRS